MRQFLLVAALMLAPLGLAACATTPVYAPAAAPGRAGYSEQRIEADRFRVVYRAASGADPGLIESYALRRAAEITVETGNDYFVVDRRVTDRGYDEGPTASVGIGSASYGRHSSFGMGVGFGFPLGGSGETANAATLDIRLGKGEKPADPNAYDARDVLSRMAPPR